LGVLIIESKQGEPVWGACPYFQQLNSIIQLNANGLPCGFSVNSVFQARPDRIGRVGAVGCSSISMRGC